ncbi:cytochrome C biogenesis protein [Natronomonas sp. F2-12]|jgi:cytochrome c-type biogenesis protein|uniref:Cytochrome C biogenesis protein n=1 Tax=Natronomonas aquatica TaxID=2841590 RepID=A0A9R1D781_9EURY|nr:cytochrome c biogenesis protein CcdA [Natronomonas aquatica]MCQ4332965.1 cytochrome C biogenesis protein [Natronomonas aquatica]
MVAGLYGAAAFAVGAGLTTFFSPCSYALLPGYVGYYAATVEDETPPLSGVLARGGAAAVGVLGTFLILSVAAVLAGDLVERLLPAVEVFVGVLLIALGVAVLVGYTGPVHVSLPERRSSVPGFALFGALYALAATACVLPLFLAVAIQSLTFSTSGTAIVLGSYAGSFGALMAAATVATAVGHDALVGRVSEHVNTLTRIAGAVLVAAGVGQLYLALVA